MGFFSSRKVEDHENIIATAAVATSNDKSVVRVIRSRFYGKKGKEREEQPAPYTSQSATITQTLSPSPAHHASVSASPRPSTSARSPLGHSILQKNTDDHPPLPITPKKKQSVEIAPPSSTSSHRKRTPSVTKIQNTDVIASPSPRRPTDTVTMTLAQRLNELAVANSEGLLNDDEYRLLRQSLFDRFAGTSVVPTEEPVVPAARPRPKKPTSMQDGRPTSRPLSNFQVEVPRPSSINSRNSLTFGVADLFRRATGRRTTSMSKDISDTASVWSTTSNSSRMFRLPRALSSSSSINTTTSRAHADTISISSKRAGGGGSDHGHTLSPKGPRSTAGSIRRMQTPPSSFHTRAVGPDSRHAINIRDVFDEDNLKTAQDIQKEILAVEAEARRLMDAFNGLELTTLSKGQRHQNGRSSNRLTDANKNGSAELNWNGSDTRSHRRYNPTESDVHSIRSATSAGTSPSVALSAYSYRKPLKSKNGLNSSLMLGSSSSLHRKNSSSSFTSTSDRRRNQILPPLPPVPALPTNISHGHLKAANNSSISLVRSTGHLPMDVVPEDEDKSFIGTVDTIRMDDEFENEMDDIRRRREEVSLRYEARLEYLRAKLKGAQLHEKLLRK